MHYIPIKLPKGKYISDIEPFKSKGIDTDCIILKEVTGCGITQYAIRKMLENLILVLPNVPVIKDKVAKHNEKFPNSKILGVHKGIDVDDVKEYLLGDVKYKKILTTPEGFMTKVKKAFKDIQVMYDSFFLLYDECERIITDVDYRGDIAAPIDDFFKFKRKAMVSATTLPFTDERFADFKYYKIEPTYKYSKSISVIGTNSIISSIQNQVKKLKSKHVCIFVNSTSSIYAIIDEMGIESESKVFCAQDSVVKLMERGYKNASSHFEVEDLVQYNFFTSRYFSAIDMKVNFKPDLILVSDVIFAEHSMLDPFTEIIQIAGRFRNGNKSLTHITNFKPNLESKTPEQALDYLKGSFDVYSGFISSYNSTQNAGSKRTLWDAIENSYVHSFYSDGRVNTFMVDNFINEERVKGYYQNFENLKAAYIFRSKHFKVTYKDDLFFLGDDDIFKLNKRQNAKEKHEQVLNIFAGWASNIDNYVFAPEELRDRFIAKYPDLWEAHIHLTNDEIEQTGYALSNIKDAVKKAVYRDKIRFLSKKVYNIFKENTEYSEADIRIPLTKIYREEGLNSRVGARTILTFFEAERGTSKGEKVYKLKGKKFIEI
jgi:hypothetical protein